MLILARRILISSVACCELQQDKLDLSSPAEQTMAILQQVMADPGLPKKLVRVNPLFC